MTQCEAVDTMLSAHDGGTYQDGGTTCDSDPCGAGVTGACCFGESCSDDETEADCSDTGGDYQGDDVECVPDLCGTTISPIGSDPPGDSIDARVPSDIACAELFGWDSIDIIYDGDTAGVEASDFIVTVDPADVSPPVIDTVASNGDTATLVFLAPIPLSHWTIITHDASGFAVRIGFLPADVSGDGTSGPVDILDLIDFLLVFGTACP